MTIIKNRRFLSAIPLAICCAATAFTPAYAATPVVTTVLDEAPPPWDGTVRRGSAQAGSSPAASSGIAGWYQQRMQRTTVSAQQLQSLQSRAGSGDADAMYQLGLLYQSGRGVTADQGQAQQWLEQAARAGNAYAQYALALLYRRQDNNALNQQSVNWQQKAAQQGYAEAQYGLGMLYANGQYVPRDLHKARHWLQQAAQRNHAMAALALADLTTPVAARPEPAVVQQTPPRAQPQPVRPSAPVADTLNSSSYAAYAAEPVVQAPPRLQPPPKVKPPMPQNPVELQQSQVNMDGKSTAEIRRAAEKGDMYAQLMYGALFEDGAGGVKQDLAQAMRWYLKAARQGYPKAQHNLALLYEDGKGVPQDYAQAAIWYKKAAQAGFSEAQNNLAVLYILGNGVEADRAQAESLLRQAVAQGNPNARRNLEMLVNGEG
jgi:hypothetical protein